MAKLFCIISVINNIFNVIIKVADIIINVSNNVNNVVIVIDNVFNNVINSIQNVIRRTKALEAVRCATYQNSCEILSLISFKMSLNYPEIAFINGINNE